MRRGGDHLLVIIHTIYVDRHVVFQRKRTNGLEKGGRRQRRKVIPTHVFSILHSAVCIHIYRVHACRHGPLEAVVICTKLSLSGSTEVVGCMHYVVKGRAATVPWKWENTHPDPFNSNTSMEFSSCRLTSSSGGAATAACTTIISEVRVTGGCVTTLGSTAL